MSGPPKEFVRENATEKLPSSPLVPSMLLLLFGAPQILVPAMQLGLTELDTLPLAGSTRIWARDWPAGALGLCPRPSPASGPARLAWMNRSMQKVPFLTACGHNPKGSEELTGSPPA